MSELCERYEEGEGGKNSQTGGGEGRGSSVSFISFRKKLSISRFQKVSKLTQNKVSASNSNEKESSPLVNLRGQVRLDILTNKKRRHDENHRDRRESGCLSKARRVVIF